jgi:hypothetical protein
MPQYDLKVKKIKKIKPKVIMKDFLDIKTGKLRFIIPIFVPVTR